MSESAEPLKAVEAQLNYLREVPTQKPAFSIHGPLPDNPCRGPQLGPRTMGIHDARPLRVGLSLDAEGVVLVDCQCSSRTTIAPRIPAPNACQISFRPKRAIFWEIALR